MPRSPKEINDAFKQIQEKVFELIDQWVEEMLNSIINNKPVQKRGLWNRFKGGVANMIYGRQNEKNPYYYLNRFGDQLGAQESTQKRMGLKSYLVLKECVETTEVNLTEALDDNLEKLNIVKTIRQEADKLKQKLDVIFKNIASEELNKGNTPPPHPPSSSSSSIAPLPSSSSSTAPPPTPSSSSSSTATSSSSSSAVKPKPKPKPKTSSSSSSVATPPPSSSSSSMGSKPKSKPKTRPVAGSSSSTEGVDSSGAVEENLILSKIYAKQDSQDDLRKQFSQGSLSKDHLLDLTSIISNLKKQLVIPLFEKLDQENNKKEADSIDKWWTDNYEKLESVSFGDQQQRDKIEDIVTRLTNGSMLDDLVVLSGSKITKKDLIEMIKNN